MKIVIAIDSLKGSLSSIQAAHAIKKGISNANLDAEVIIKPLADGGEGTVDALVDGMNGQRRVVSVCGPAIEKVDATYGVLSDNKTAIMEMAQAAGITYVEDSQKNPLTTTTYGVGEMIKLAINEGCRHFIMGIGGSATNDAGVGMLQALGFKFYDENDNLVKLGGQVLNQITRIDCSGKIKELDECTFKIACDVNNPLFGLNGAAHVYGPQKGATPEIIEQLDKGLINFSNVVKNDLNKDLCDIPGVGAAGGLGYGFLAFLNAKLESGIKIILDEINIEESIKDADIVVTGEGRLDNQTAMGKAPIGVAKLAKKYGVTVIAIAGCVADEAAVCNEEGIDAFFSILNEATTIENAMDTKVAENNLINTSTQIFNLVKSLKYK